MAIKPIVIGVAVSVVILACFSVLLDNASQLKPEVPRSIIKEEQLRNISTQDGNQHAMAKSGGIIKTLIMVHPTLCLRHYNKRPLSY